MNSELHLYKNNGAYYQFIDLNESEFYVESFIDNPNELQRSIVPKDFFSIVEFEEVDHEKAKFMLMEYEDDGTDSAQ